MTNTKQQYALFSFGSALIFFVTSQVFTKTNFFNTLQFESSIFFSLVFGISCFLLHCFLQNHLVDFYKRSLWVFISLFVLPFVQLLQFPIQESISILSCLLFLGFNYRLFFAESLGLLPCLVFGFPILVLNPLFLPVLLTLSYITFPLQREKTYLIFSAYMIPFLFHWIHLSEVDINSGFFSKDVMQWIHLNEVFSLPDISIAALLLLFFIFFSQSQTNKEKPQITRFVTFFFFIALLINHQSLFFVLFACLFILVHLLNPRLFDQLKALNDQHNLLVGFAIVLYFFYLRAVLPII
ncbi:MAG: hypothetical protein KC646_13280 [Candidatus Cloacimonetes bacterium]|nr:hypothetical protein [Candidatus Cloacimonadota bacterium]